jgi:hypothetical protein
LESNDTKLIANIVLPAKQAIRHVPFAPGVCASRTAIVFSIFPA